MKKFFIFILTLLLVFSCNESINLDLYPFLSFEINEDGETCGASVLKGIRAESITVPSRAVIDGKEYDVVSLDYKSIEDAEPLKTIKLESSEIVINPEIFNYASSFESIEQTKHTEDGKWHLPILPHNEETHAIWMVGDKVIHDGDPLEKEGLVATLIYGPHNDSTIAHDYTYHWKQCSVCGKQIGDKELHHFKDVDGNLICDCGYVKRDSETSGGFDVNVDLKIPMGRLSVIENSKNNYSITLIDENPNYPITTIKWIVDGEELSNNSTTIEIETTEKRSYSVLCIFFNDLDLAGSASSSVSGS